MAIREAKKVAKANEIRSRMAEIEDDLIRKKAYNIHIRDNCNDAVRNWLLAKKELQTI